ncbi:MAG: BTB/POZ domain-containing protein [Candidatus Micrarchaeaceae archaeon]
MLTLIISTYYQCQIFLEYKMSIDFSPLIYKNLSEIINKNYDCVIVLNNNEEILAHKIVLSSEFYYFETLFSTRLIDIDNTIYYVKYDDYDIIKKIIDIVYGDIKIKSREEIRVLYALDFLIPKNFSIRNAIKSMQINPNQISKYINMVNDLLTINDSTISYIISKLDKQSIEYLPEQLDNHILNLMLKHLNNSRILSAISYIKIYELSGNNYEVFFDTSFNVAFNASNNGRYICTLTRDKIKLLDMFIISKKQYEIKQFYTQNINEEDLELSSFIYKETFNPNKYNRIKNDKRGTREFVINFSYDNSYVAVLINFYLLIFLIHNGELIIIKIFKYVEAFTWSPNDKYILFYSNFELKYFNVSTTELVIIPFHTTFFVTSLSWYKKDFILLTTWMTSYYSYTNLFIIKEFSDEIIYTKRDFYANIIKYSLTGDYFLFYHPTSEDVEYWIHPNVKDLKQIKFKTKNISKFINKNYFIGPQNIEISGDGKLLIIDKYIVTAFDHTLVLGLLNNELCWLSNNYIKNYIRKKYENV